MFNVSYTNTIYNLNWREKRLVPGYYGCGHCDLCRCSIFGDKFKVQYTNHWFKIQGTYIYKILSKERNRPIIKPAILDSLDCESTNVLYLVTCLMCPDHVQFGSFATDMRKQLKDHKVTRSALHFKYSIV